MTTEPAPRQPRPFLPANATADPSYAARRERSRKFQASQSAKGRDIGAIPPVADPLRRARASRDFRAFCESYFRHRFTLAWSDDHLKVIAKIEDACLHGGLFALAMPRGSGKTSLLEAAILWAKLYGYHHMVAGLAATKAKARDILESLKMELECNEPIGADFPEVCHPIRALEGIANRCAGQTHQGVRTRISWTKDMIILPTVAGSPASGGIVRVGGLTGADIRGMKYTRPDGEVVRPTLALIDDPQTDKTARSNTQNKTRLGLLNGAVLGMAGPGKKLSAFMAATVIQPDDMADQVLNPSLHPDWNGLRTQMVYAWPTNDALWEKYAELRADGLRAGDKGAKATDFYRRNRRRMDAGARVAWPEQFDPDELSNIQHAVNLRLRDEETFASEHQNEPLKADASADILTAVQIAAKLNLRKVDASGYATVPTKCTRLTMYIDVHKRLLFWIVMAWEPGFTGYVLAYGTWPGQKVNQFAYRTVRRTLQVAYPKRAEEAAIYAGLTDLAGEVLPRQWQRDDGAALRVGLCLVDCGYQKETVDRFCRQNVYTNLILPAKGIPITASSRLLEEATEAKGQEVGTGYRVTKAQGTQSLRLVLLDSNYWKSFLHARLATPMAQRGCVSLPGKSDTAHRLLAEHWTAETPVQTEGRGRKLAEWKLPVHKPDNHWLDAAAGACAAAGILGITLMQRALPKSHNQVVKPRRARKSGSL
jgi:hypothetical protein